MRSNILGLMMKPCVLDLFLLFIATYSVHVFPIENEVINKVYHELRDIVKLASTSNTSSNTTQPNVRSNLTHSDAVDAIEITDANINNTSQENERSIQRNTDKSLINELFNLSRVPDVSLSIKKDNTSFTAPGIVFDQNEINSNVSSNQSESRHSNNSSKLPAQTITKRHIRKIEEAVEAVNTIYDVLPLRHKREVESFVLTNEIQDILHETNMGEAESQLAKRESEKGSEIYGKLSDEFEDILPQNERSKRETLSRMEKRDSGEEDVVSDEVVSEFDDLMPVIKWNEKEILRKTRERDDESIQDGELTNEIEDVLNLEGSEDGQHDQRGKVHTAYNHGDNFKRHLRGSIWRRQSTYNANNDESAHIPNNHMYHAEHGHHYVRHHSSNMPNDHRENNHDADDYNEKEWHKYHHKKFHHVKFKLHGEGKTPSEWAKQEAKEMADQSVIYDQGTYHSIDNLPESIAAGFFHLRCEDCVISSY